MASRIRALEEDEAEGVAGATATRGSGMMMSLGVSGGGEGSAEKYLGLAERERMVGGVEPK